MPDETKALFFRLTRLLRLQPAGITHFGLLFAPADSEAIRGDLVGDRRARRNVAAAANFYRSHSLRIASNKNIVFDDRFRLIDPVVVAGDEAAA